MDQTSRERRKRGRPFRPPVDSSPYADPTGGADARIAWLLGTRRLSALDGEYATRRTFVPALAESGGFACDESRVSRWESGSGPVPAAVLTGYEKVLGLPRHSLRAAALTLGPALPATAVRQRPTDEKFDRLMEVVLDGAPNGADWFTLADELSHRPPIYLRRELWATLSRQLIHEASRSLHVAYLTRRAALRRLFAHPVVGPHLVSALEEYVAEPGAVRRADAASLAAAVPGPDATALAMRLLREGSDSVRRGALRAAGWLLATGHFDEEALPELEPVLLDGLRASGAAVHLADVARRLPPAAAERVRSALPDHPALATVDRNSETVPAELAESSARQLVQAVQAAAPAPLREPDSMLERLLREALFHSHDQRRRQAAYLLMSSPYRDAVAAGCAVVVGGPDARVRTAVARLMRYCTTTAQLPTLLGMAADSDGETQRVALVALGNNPYPLTERQAQVLLSSDAPWSTRRHVDAVSYALGMHGLGGLVTDPERLRQLGDGREGLDRALANAKWWQTAGSRLTS
ncbi:hypothetical protein [Nocardioides sp. CER19]|uniref:hypothetical protein n=1 Tax=Nocardioides sp. CER19 TaxID=3038538 RepID=UPI002449D75C|nr:hypothetical protein [Nocardioides sp. CER19]MDH2412970.1 hypothetical protein [Nocardioides sp. CER19]